MKRFHGVLAGNVHVCLLKSSIGKASSVAQRFRQYLRATNCYKFSDRVYAQHLTGVSRRFFPCHSQAVTRRCGDGAMGLSAAPRRLRWLGVPFVATTHHSDGWHGVTLVR
jgi:hypothetical protein